MNFTVFNSLNPAPAFNVSLIWDVVESFKFSLITPTIPPCAYLELLSPNLDFVINNIPSGKFACCSTFNAAYNPAIPLPITTVEYFEYFISASNYLLLTT